VAGRWLLHDALAYLPGPWTRVQVVEAGWRTWPEHDQADAAGHVDQGGPSSPAPDVVASILGPWPQTPLVPIR
jgi:hypothetical protein